MQGDSQNDSTFSKWMKKCAIPLPLLLALIVAATFWGRNNHGCVMQFDHDSPGAEYRAHWRQIMLTDAAWFRSVVTSANADQSSALNNKLSKSQIEVAWLLFPMLGTRAEFELSNLQRRKGALFFETWELQQQIAKQKEHTDLERQLLKDKVLILKEEWKNNTVEIASFWDRAIANTNVLSLLQEETKLLQQQIDLSVSPSSIFSNKGVQSYLSLQRLKLRLGEEIAIGLQTAHPERFRLVCQEKSSGTVARMSESHEIKALMHERALMTRDCFLSIAQTGKCGPGKAHLQKVDAQLGNLLTTRLLKNETSLLMQLAELQLGEKRNKEKEKEKENEKKETQLRKALEENALQHAKQHPSGTPSKGMFLAGPSLATDQLYTLEAERYGQDATIFEEYLKAEYALGEALT